ncbi:unnamed protein product [Tilletia controversa]|nr:unnamed protein product [Tilletia controversa]
MPSTPRILPLGSLSISSGSHSNKRAVPEPEVKVKQETTTTSTKRTHGTFDDSRYITSLNDPRLTQVLEYAPHSQTDTCPGIVLLDPLNRPLSPSNSGCSKSFQRSSSPASVLSRATPSPFLMPSPYQAFFNATPTSRAEPSTPGSFETHFSNFTATIATPTTSSSMTNEVQRPSPSRWFSTVGQAGSSSCTGEPQANSGMLSPFNAYQLMLQRRPGLEISGPSRPQSARPASTDPDDVRLPSRLGHKRKTSLQDNPMAAVRPKYSNSSGVPVEGAKAPFSTVKSGRFWDITPQPNHKRGFFDGTSASLSSTTPIAEHMANRVGPPPGMPAWVHLPISDALRPGAQRNGSVASERSVVSLASAVDSTEAGDSTIQTPQQGLTLQAESLETPGDGDDISGQDTVGKSPAVQALLETAQTMPRSQSFSGFTKKIITQTQMGDNTASMQPTRPELDATSPVDQGKDVVRSGFFSRMVRSSSASSSMNIFIGSPQLRGFLKDSPQSRCATPVRSSEVSEGVQVHCEAADKDRSEVERLSGGERQAANADLESGLNIRYEMARRCAGSIAKPQLTVDEIDMKELKSAMASVSPSQPSRRPPLKIVRPKPRRSSLSPIMHHPANQLLSPLTPISPDENTTPTGQQESTRGFQEDEQVLDGSRTRPSLLQRRRLSSGNPLDLPTLTFHQDAQAARAKSPGVAPLGDIQLSGDVNRAPRKGLVPGAAQELVAKESCGERITASTNGTRTKSQRPALKPSPPIAITPARPWSTSGTRMVTATPSRVFDETNKIRSSVASQTDGPKGSQQSRRMEAKGQGKLRFSSSVTNSNGTQRLDRPTPSPYVPRANQALLARARSPAPLRSQGSKQGGTAASPLDPQIKGKAKMCSTDKGKKGITTLSK